MINDILMLILLTVAPFLELRASIPYGIFKTDLHWSIVFVICVIANILLAPLLYFFLDNIVFLFLKINFVDKIYKKYVDKTQKKIKKYVDKYGVLGMSIFIGVPLPGSGVYSAALGAYALGMGYRKFILASILGVLIAGIAVLAICLTGSEMFRFFIQ